MCPPKGEALLLVVRLGNRHAFPHVSNMLQLATIENEQQHYADTYARIGEIEYGREEHEIIATPEWHPVGPCGLYDREIEHIYHLAIQE